MANCFWFYSILAGWSTWQLVFLNFSQNFWSFDIPDTPGCASAVFAENEIWNRLKQFLPVCIVDPFFMSNLNSCPFVCKIIVLCTVKCTGHRPIDSYLLVYFVIEFPTSFQIATSVFPSTYNRGLFSKNTNPTKQSSFIFLDSKFIYLSKTINRFDSFRTTIGHLFSCNKFNIICQYSFEIRVLVSYSLKRKYIILYFMFRFIFAIICFEKNQNSKIYVIFIINIIWNNI